MQNDEVLPKSYIICKNLKKKRIRDVNIGPKAIKLLEENVGKSNMTTIFSSDSLDMTSKAR